MRDRAGKKEAEEEGVGDKKGIMEEKRRMGMRVDEGFSMCHYGA